ncbi:MAG: B12-binding domain-containing radical SAM protein [Thermoleophilia bacterium]
MPDGTPPDSGSRKRVLLVYPYFKPRRDRSIFRFPPLGVAYLAAALRDAGHEVEVLDCTFLKPAEAYGRVANGDADVVGVYGMLTMRPAALEFGRIARLRGALTIAGGPLPSCDPESFVDDFDLVVRGEGERTIVEILAREADFGIIPGVVFREGGPGSEGAIVHGPPRALRERLDEIAPPARDLLPNRSYIAHWLARGGTPTTSVLTTRGCPFRCEFCSNAVFGVSYRERAATSVVDEIEQVLELGYGRVHVADDVFTLNKTRLLEICTEIGRRGLRFSWECLGRVDSVDAELAIAMRTAGCDRIFFGIESGDNEVLRLMGKRITIEKARRAVEAARAAGIAAGGFFILGYPGESDETVLRTIGFATSLPLTYLSFTMPYPLPYTALWERVRGQVTREWIAPRSGLVDHVLTYEGDFSERKMRLAILKGQIEFALRSKRGLLGAMGPLGPLAARPFASLTDAAFRRMR